MHLKLGGGMQVDKDLREMLIKKDAPKPKLIGLRIWPKAIPQFNVGHQDLLEVSSRCPPPLPPPPTHLRARGER